MKENEHLTQASLKRQIEELDREEGYRLRLYPRWIEEGRMTRDEANARVLAIRHARRTVQGVYEEMHSDKSLDLFRDK